MKDFTHLANSNEVGLRQFVPVKNTDDHWFPILQIFSHFNKYASSHYVERQAHLAVFYAAPDYSIRELLMLACGRYRQHKKLTDRIILEIAFNNKIPIAFITIALSKSGQIVKTVIEKKENMHDCILE